MRPLISERLSLHMTADFVVWLRAKYDIDVLCLTITLRDQYPFVWHMAGNVMCCIQLKVGNSFKHLNIVMCSNTLVDLYVIYIYCSRGMNWVLRTCHKRGQKDL